MDKNKLLSTMCYLIDEHHIPTIQVGIIKNNKIIFCEGIGYRDYERKIASDNKTLFAIGSCTKAFTAEAIAILVDEERLEWEKPIKQYLPEFEMFDRDATDSLTVRDILCHRSGLPRHDLTWYLSLDQFSLKDIVHNLRYLEPTMPLRYGMQYQNHMYALAGYLIERVYGEKWNTFVSERLLVPLGMTNTNFSIKDMVNIANKALPYYYKDNKIQRMAYRNIDSIGSAGSMNSNIEDMLKWVQFNLSKGKWHGKTIIREENINECHKAQITNIEPSRPRTHFEEIQFCSYGLGWFTDIYKGHKVIFHGGGIDGFISITSFMPEINSGFVILTNGHKNVVPSILQNILYDILFDCDETDWNARYLALLQKEEQDLTEKKNKIYNSAPKNTKPSLDLDEYTGEYENEAYGRITILCENKNLKLMASNSEAILEHLCFDNFILQLVDQELYIPVMFNLDLAGKVSNIEMDLEPALGKMIMFGKIYK